MVFTIAEKKIIVVKGKKNRQIFLVEDTQELKVTIYPADGKPISTFSKPIEDIFSIKGLTVKNYNIRAYGNSQMVRVIVLNLKTREVMEFNHYDMLDRYYLDTKLPRYVKSVLNRISSRLIEVKRKIELKPITPISKTQTVLAVSCPKKNGELIPVSMCKTCPHAKYRYIEDKPKEAYHKDKMKVITFRPKKAIFSGCSYPF